MRKKIGILGGSFDPPHKGHKWAVEVCAKDMDLIYVIPSYQTPGKTLSQVHINIRMHLCILSGSTRPSLRKRGSGMNTV